jgi:hypothetical protein
MFVPHRKHITSPLRAQQVNALYRFVTREKRNVYRLLGGKLGYWKESQRERDH